MQIILLFLLLCFSPAVWAMGHLPTQMSSDPLIGKPAPDAVLIKTDGTSSSIMSSRQGKKAILIFWATWCPHCYEELGAVNENIASVGKKGIKIILVDLGETLEVVKNYFDQRQMHLTSFIDVDSFLQGTYHLEGIPTIIFIDEKGIIRNVTHAFPSDYVQYFK